MPINKKLYFEEVARAIAIVSILFLIPFAIGYSLNAPGIGMVLGSVLASAGVIYLAGEMSEEMERTYIQKIKADMSQGKEIFW